MDLSDDGRQPELSESRKLKELRQNWGSTLPLFWLIFRGFHVGKYTYNRPMDGSWVSSMVQTGPWVPMSRACLQNRYFAC